MSRYAVCRHPSEWYNLYTGNTQFHQKLDMVRGDKRRAMLFSPLSMFSSTSELYSCLPQLSRSSISKQEVKKNQTASLVLHLTSHLSSAYCSKSECLLRGSCQFLGEVLEKQALVIRSNAVSDCWVFILARLNSELCSFNLYNYPKSCGWMWSYTALFSPCLMIKTITRCANSNPVLANGKISFLQSYNLGLICNVQKPTWLATAGRGVLW